MCVAVVWLYSKCEWGCMSVRYRWVQLCHLKKKSSTLDKKWPFSISNTASVSSSVMLTFGMNPVCIMLMWFHVFGVCRCAISLISISVNLKATTSLCLASKMTLYSLMRWACCQKESIICAFFNLKIDPKRP